MIAHKSSMSAMKTALEKNKILELEMQSESHKKEIGELIVDTYISSLFCANLYNLQIYGKKKGYQ